MPLVHESEKLIEAMPKGMKIRRTALVPFPKQSRSITGRLQGIRPDSKPAREGLQFGPVT